MGNINAILVAEKIGFYHKLFGVNLLPYLKVSLNLGHIFSPMIVESMNF